jgi:hypothetical protein
VKVKNINGTSPNTCNCGSWLDHWIKFSGQELPQYCSELSCVAKPELGAHVQKNSSSDRNWYIIPLCAKHNAKAESLDIVDVTTLVSANVSDTCGK